MFCGSHVSDHARTTANSEDSEGKMFLRAKIRWWILNVLNHFKRKSSGMPRICKSTRNPRVSFVNRAWRFKNKGANSPRRLTTKTHAVKTIVKLFETSCYESQRREAPITPEEREEREIRGRRQAYPWVCEERKQFDLGSLHGNRGMTISKTHVASISV